MNSRIILLVIALISIIALTYMMYRHNKLKNTIRDTLSSLSNAQPIVSSADGHNPSDMEMLVGDAIQTVANPSITNYIEDDTDDDTDNGTDNGTDDGNDNGIEDAIDDEGSTVDQHDDDAVAIVGEDNANELTVIGIEKKIQVNKTEPDIDTDDTTVSNNNEDKDLIDHLSTNDKMTNGIKIDFESKSLNNIDSVETTSDIVTENITGANVCPPSDGLSNEEFEEKENIETTHKTSFNTDKPRQMYNAYDLRKLTNSDLRNILQSHGATMSKNSRKSEIIDKILEITH